MASAETEQLTSEASNRIIPILKTIRTSVIFIQSIIFALVLFLLPRRSDGETRSPVKSYKRRSVWRREEEDTMRRRALAEGIKMGFKTDNREIRCRWSTSLFSVLEGTLCFADRGTGHGGSDGLHGYVPSLDKVVADTGAFLEKIKSENLGVSCFLFGHSTGEPLVLKATSYPHIRAMLDRIALSEPALRVEAARPIVGFKGASKRGIPISRNPAALLAKYSDPLVYTGPIRVRTSHEIFRISSYLIQTFKPVTVSFFVLHGTADKVIDLVASEDLFNAAASMYKDVKLHEGFLHDLLFEPERDEVAQDITKWMEKRLVASVEKVDSLPS